MGGNMAKKILIILLLLPFVSLFGEDFLLNENFNSLDNWKPLYFDKIDEHSTYTIEDNILKAESNKSASGIIFKKEFNVYKYPVVKWKWKAENIIKKGNALEKSGDDYPIRVYVMFKYDPDKAGFWESTMFGSIKLIYGEYPPQSSLNYIWANRKHKQKIIESPYTDRSMMLVLQSGKKNLDKWVTEEINILKDYKKAFGENPPEIATIGIMADSDNTSEKSKAFIDYIQVFNRK